MRMPQELKTKWIEALESGEYTQGKGALCDEGSYCCLGVLQHVVDGDVERTVLCKESLQMPTKEWYDAQGVQLRTTDDDRGTWEDVKFAQMNDLGDSFATIAEFIRTKVEGY